jgi:hypothetical protein
VIKTSRARHRIETRQLRGCIRRFWPIVWSAASNAEASSQIVEWRLILFADDIGQINFDPNSFLPIGTGDFLLSLTY